MAAKSKAMETLRKAALAYPETREDHPWGEIAIKVKGKVFVFMGYSEDGSSPSTGLASIRAGASTETFSSGSNHLMSRP